MKNEAEKFDSVIRKLLSVSDDEIQRCYKEWNASPQLVNDFLLDGVRVVLREARGDFSPIGAWRNGFQTKLRGLKTL